MNNVSPDEHEGQPSRLSISFSEFITLMASLMALTALSIDIMLPALPDIGQAFAVETANDRQLVVSGYLVGLAIGQLFWGPLSDRLGRKGPLLLGLALFASAALTIIVVPTFKWLIFARFMQGFGGAAARVIAMAIVRDLFVGRNMARVMSTVMMVFIMVPIFAPAVGQGLLHVGGWSTAFWLLAVVGFLAAIWAAMRLPETAHSVDNPRSSILGGLASAFVRVMSQRVSVGYGVAAGFMFGCLVTYITSAQQIFVDVYGLGAAFPLAFGSVAVAMALAAFTNSRIVQRVGMRRVSHVALGMFLLASAALTLATMTTRPSLWVVGPLLGLCFYLFGLIQPNFNSIAMQPVGDVAGMASSLLGAYTTFAGAVFGTIVARQFDGSVRHLAVGFLLLNIAAIASVVWVEGRAGLFRGE